jgi:hypothetical protein
MFLELWFVVLMENCFIHIFGCNMVGVFPFSRLVYKNCVVSVVWSAYGVSQLHVGLTRYRIPRLTRILDSRVLLLVSTRTVRSCAPPAILRDPAMQNSSAGGPILRQTIDSYLRVTMPVLGCIF